MDKRELFGDEVFQLDYLPTPEQIAERAAEIRRGWDEETRQLRLRGWACGPSNEDREAGRRAEAMARAALL